MRDEPQRGLGNDTQHPLAAHHEAHEVETRLVFVAAASGLHDGAICQHRLQTQHIVAGDAVFEAARTTCIGGDVSAQAALLEGGGVWRIKPPQFAHLILQMPGDDAGLDHRHTVFEGDLLDLVHARHG